MSLSVGIIGLPNVGKSTLFNAIMGKQQALTAPYPFATVKPNVGVVDVPDERLIKLKEAMIKSGRSDIVNKTPVVYSSITFVDIAGLVKGAAEGHGLGNQFLSNIRDVDVILHVVRDFDPPAGGPDVPRHEDSKDPENDIKIIETELELKDLELKEANEKYEDYLSKKPVIYAINIAENNVSKEGSIPIFSGVARQTQDNSQVDNQSLLNDHPIKSSISNLNSELTDDQFPGKKVSSPSSDGAMYFCARLEEEISRLPKKEQKDYLAMYDLAESGLDRIIKECYKLLGLIPFLTVGKIEVRAWSLKKGSPAPVAAGVIHSDFEKLLIRAEIIGWEKMIEAGSWQAAKEKGWVRIEGRDYVVQDGDVCNFLIGK